MRRRTTLSLLAISAVLFLSINAGSNNQPAFAQGDYSMVNTRDTVHINNCGACHLPYSPGLLPTESWRRIMSSLDEHFGVAVELNADNSSHIISYLEKYALQPDQDSIMGQLAKDLPSPPPTRITELPAFIEMHSNAALRVGFESIDEAPLASCENCHRAAASHIFDKSLLQIGHGDGRLNDYK